MGDAPRSLAQRPEMTRWCLNTEPGREVWLGFQSRDLWSLTSFLALGSRQNTHPAPTPWVFRYLSTYDPIKEKPLLAASPGYLVTKDKLYTV